ncbi:MAG TPA: hypothetical protein VH740_15315 [Vicinamibacterales bacterium]|jgi:hypothetical protein
MSKLVTSSIEFIACGVLVVSAIPGFAQSNTASDRRPAYATVNAVNLYDAALSARYDNVTLPANLTVTPVYRETVAAMLERSATFRRQCARIARAAEWLTIELRSDSRSAFRVAAWTTIQRRRGGRMHAAMTVSPTSRLPELIAHEIEHVIEQIDGIDLSRKSRLGASGVRQCDCGSFDAYETTRAIVTGLKVAREVAAGGRQGVP